LTKVLLPLQDVQKEEFWQVKHYIGQDSQLVPFEKKALKHEQRLFDAKKRTEEHVRQILLL
jgi:hypothetical protein